MSPRQRRRRRGSEKTAGWRLFAGFAIPAVASFVRLRIRGRDKLPKRGAFILTPNHYSNVDPLVMGYAMWKLGRVPRFLAKSSLFRVPVLATILKRTGQIPVERGLPGARTGPLDAASRLTDDGLAVIVYPEGTLTRDPDEWPMRGKSGAVRLALEHDVPIVPAAHWGAQKILGRYSSTPKLFPRTTVDVIIGDPVDLSRWRGRPLDGPVLAEATDAVMAAITGLVEQLRGERAPLERWDPADHGQTEFGREK